MKNTVGYPFLTNLVRSKNHSEDQAPFDASAYYEWDDNADELDDLQVLVYQEDSE